MRGQNLLPHPSFIDRTGQRFGRLVALSYLRLRGKGASRWICRCDCGAIIHVAANNLKSKNSQSCGCLMLDKVSRHGDYKTSEYCIWSAMSQRCSNPNAPEYRNYGARGILVCDRWNPKKTDSAYLNFLEDMGRRPGKMFSLERKNNNEGYNPGNCEWADKKAQRLNQRTRVIMISRNGKTQCALDWARECGFRVGRLYQPIRRGANPETILERILNHTKQGGRRAIF